MSDARDHSCSLLRDLTDLLSGGPDTSCRTIWDGDVECVSIPFADISAILVAHAHGDPVHFWLVADQPADPSEPWSRTFCDRGRESRFPEGSQGAMTATWESVTCPECLAARP